jgi:glycosyltransferase involved in cell wall biosynthesis
MRRILLLITDLEIGGTPTVVRELAVRIRDAGAHVEVVGLSKEGPLGEQLKERGIRCVGLGARGTRDAPRAVWRLVRLLRSERIDTVFSFLMHANAVAAVASLSYPRARYLQSIQTTQAWPRWHWGVQRLVAVAAERVVCPSPSVAAVARRWAGVAASNLVVIPNAVEVGEFGRDGGTRWPAKPQAEGKVSRVGFIGRLDPIKRIPDLLAAMALLPPDVHLDVYGDGIERTRIEGEIIRLSLASRATLHGTIARPQEALSKIDLLVLPSDAEGFGLVLIEAMAAGVPVVATDVAGIRDVVRHGETGVLVPPRSPNALAGAVRCLIENRALRERLVANALVEVGRRFTWKAVLPQYLHLLGMPAQWATAGKPAR